MAKYILSYDRLKKDVDPFEDIVRLLYEAKINPESIGKPVQSIIYFSCNEVEIVNLHKLENELAKYCYYILSMVQGLVSMKPQEDLFINSKNEITNIIDNLSKQSL
jgi:hypothetical protein